MNDHPFISDGPLKEDRIVETVVPGFRAAMAKAGIRKDGREDLALIVAEEPVAAAGVFTQNPMAAAPVLVSKKYIAKGTAQAILVNSGNANAATGKPGLDACLASCTSVVDALGCMPGEVLPCSTGVIGELLDAGKIEAAVHGLVKGLHPQGLKDVAYAIRTTDASLKMAEATCVVHGKEVRVVGLAKGAGMIRPDMATMLAFVLTDAVVTHSALQMIISAATEMSFNRITVDGDTSPNDTLFILASGKAGNQEIIPGDPESIELGGAVTTVCQNLANMIVADGEGAGHLVGVFITGAPNLHAARNLAYAVAHSPLCKTAFASGDPYWGRILSAAGSEASRRGIFFDPERTKVWIGGHLLGEGGSAAPNAPEEAAAAEMKKERYTVRLDLGEGKSSFWVLTTDLDHAYVSLNLGYRS